MKTYNTLSLLAGFALTIASAVAFAASQPDANQNVAPAVGSPQNGDDAKQGDYEEQTQGPVHEAFAEPVVFDPQPGIVVPDAPPDPIKEIQPAEKPDGTDVIWIGGYWGWDAEKKDFIWVSGIWRVQPADRQWTPGTWNKVDGGYQWTSGFWAPIQSDDQSLQTKLPKPPKSLEKGPSSPAPDDQHVWIPGYWDHSGSEYAWSGGYWSAGYPDRVYIPSHYVCFPDGYVFVGGYWDYPVATRGFLFAPVYFPSHAYASVGFSFTPGLVISTAFFLDNIFANPHYGHYYFGNYYDPSCASFGIYPAYSPVFLSIGFSDIWEHDCWDHQHGHHDDWDHHKYKSFREAYQHEREDWFTRLRDNASERPGRTFQENAARMASAPKGERGALAARPFKQVLADKKFVGEFAKQSRQSVASARQAILDDRKNVRTEAVQNAIQQKNAGRLDQAREKLMNSDNFHAGREKVMDHKQQVQDTDRQAMDKSIFRRDAVHSPSAHSPALRDENATDMINNTDNSRIDREKVLDHKSPLEDSGKSAAERTPLRKEAVQTPVINSDKSPSPGNDTQIRVNSRPINSQPAIHSIIENGASNHTSGNADNRPVRTPQNERSNDDKKNQNERHDDR